MPNRDRWNLVLLLLLAWGVLLLYINRPFAGHHDANGIWLGAAARNLRVYPLAEVTLVPLLSRGPIPPDVPNYYVHHPPLVVWLSALSETIWGERELALRLVSIFSTLISIAGFAVFCCRLLGPRYSVVCAALYTLTPMILYFGRMPNHEPLSLAFLMIALANYVRWLKEPSAWRWGWIAISSFLAIASAWAAFFFIVAIAVFGLIVMPRRRVGLIGLVAVAGLALVSVVGLYALQYPPTFERLMSAFIWRSSTVSEISVTFTWLEFAGQTLIHLIATTTLALLILALVGIAPLWRAADGSQRSVLLALLLAGLGYNILFRSASYVHDYYKIYLMPFLAISAGYGLIFAVQQARWKRLARPAVTGLILASSAVAIVFMSRWYSTDPQPFERRLAAKIASETQPADLVVTNLSPANPLVEYYAFREIVWDTNPADAAAQQTGGTIRYLDCAWGEPDMTDDALLEACRFVPPSP